MLRRRFVQGAASLNTIPTLISCNMSKSNITSFGKTYKYLSDPELVAGRQAMNRWSSKGHYSAAQVFST